MVQKRADVSEYKDKVDIGIITIREDEWGAILQRIPREELAIGRQTYAISRLKTINEDDYVIASVRCLEPGNNQGQAVARTLLEELNPQWILLVGIAGSIPDYEYTLGDVLLASRLHDFCVSAVVEGEDSQIVQQFAGGGGPMMPEVQSLVAALPILDLEEWNSPEAISVPRPEVKLAPSNFYGMPDWKKKVKACLERYFGKKSIRDYPKAFSGSVASSDILLKNTQVGTQWLSTNRQIKGVEMELAGVYKAANDFKKPVLAIRGISDVVGFKRSQEWTEYACHTAASFTHALLRFRPFPPRSAQSTVSISETKDVSKPQNQQVGVFKQKPPEPLPLSKKETLFSNLLEITYYPETIYLIETDCKDRNAVWAILNNETEDPPADWIYRGKTLYAFHDFSDPIWKKVGEDNIAEAQTTRHWADSQDQDRIGEFIELLGNCFKEFGKGIDLRYIHKQWVNGEKKTFKYMYYAPATEFTDIPSFRMADFADADVFATSLRDKQTPLAEYLLTHLPVETQELVAQYPASSNSAFWNTLIYDLNQILKTDFYDPALFEEIHMRWEARKLLEKEHLEEDELKTLNRMLLEDTYGKVINKRILATRKITIKSLVRYGTTEVFKASLSKSGRLAYYRHHAFRPHFVRIDGKWCLEITPTYHYTWNGFNVSSNYEEYVKKIKRMERSGAVFRQVMFWARILQDVKSEFLEQKTYPYLQFGDLLEFQFDYGIADDAWLNREVIGEGGRKPKDSQSSGSLFT
jgi:nucleoside phosphorylase